MSITVGDRLWVVSEEKPRREPWWGDVVSVGRKWVTVRTDRETLTVHKRDLSIYWQGACVGQCYRTKQEWDVVVVAEQAWQRLRERIGFKLPRGLTAERIAEAEQILFRESEGS